jgi:hypothetical protein
MQCDDTEIAAFANRHKRHETDDTERPRLPPPPPIAPPEPHARTSAKQEYSTYILRPLKTCLFWATVRVISRSHRHTTKCPKPHAHTHTNSRLVGTRTARPEDSHTLHILSLKPAIQLVSASKHLRPRPSVPGKGHIRPFMGAPILSRMLAAYLLLRARNQHVVRLFSKMVVAACLLLRARNQHVVRLFSKMVVAAYLLLRARNQHVVRLPVAAERTVVRTQVQAVICHAAGRDARAKSRGCDSLGLELVEDLEPGGGEFAVSDFVIKTYS